MKNLIKLSRSRHGVIPSLLLRLNLNPPSILPSLSPSSSSSIQTTSSSVPISDLQSPNIQRSVKPFQILNPSFSFHGTSLGLRIHRFYSSESKSNTEDSKSPNEFKHQEIEGPTVERDLTPLANETREVSLRLMKTMYDLSRILAVLSLSQLSLGAWISYTSSSPSPSPAITAMSVVAFALPFSMAFMLRQSLKHMQFFNKMEQIGRLQILTSTMQISKHVHLFFVRLRVIAYFCLAGLPLPFLLSSLFSSSSSSS